jgi:pyruvate/2-oxoglutarate dehydrogenase complex dihydrolipoamide dehydrogenase (E3) component
MGEVLRARALCETRGFLKALVAPDSDRILGITVIGGSAGEIMSAAQIAMIAGLPYTALRDAILGSSDICGRTPRVVLDGTFCTE